MTIGAARVAGRVACLLLVLGFLLGSLPARAQSASAQARVLFGEARKLMNKGRFDEACPKLEESLRLDHGIGTQFNLAHCWEQIGRTASAWGLFLDVASAAATAGQRKREAAARERADALEPQLARLLIEVSDPVSGLTVLRSGETVGRASWGTAMPVDPGTQRIEASAPDRLPWSKEVDVDVPGATVSVAIPALESEVPEPVQEAASTEDTPEPIDEDRSARGIGTGRIVTSTLLAVIGVGAGVAGTVFALKAQSETAAARKLCIGGAAGTLCDRDINLPDFDTGVRERSELERHRENADRATLISYVGWGVGVAGLAASVVVLMTAPSEDGELDAGHLELEPTFTSNLVGATLRGSF